MNGAYWGLKDWCRVKLSSVGANSMEQNRPRWQTNLRCEEKVADGTGCAKVTRLSTVDRVIVLCGYASWVMRQESYSFLEDTKTL